MEKQMKLSNQTLAILKNFSTINKGIQFKAGSKLATVSSGKTVLANAILHDDFPVDFCVYDLNQFLSVHSMFKESVELEFDASNIIFTSGRNSLKYRMTAPEMIILPPDKEITLPSIDCSFTLTTEDYEWIMKACSVLSSPHIGVKSDGETIEIVTFDANDDSAHTNSISVGEADGNSYSVVFKVENIKMIPGTYDVNISFRGIGHFKNTVEDVQYWIAYEAKESKV